LNAKSKAKKENICEISTKLFKNPLSLTLYNAFSQILEIFENFNYAA
jgi:hypothetical protein